MKIHSFEEFSNSILETKVALSTITDGTYQNLRLKDIVGSDQVSKNLLDDIATACEKAGVRAYVTCAISDHPSTSYKSRHVQGEAVDISRVGYATTPWEKIPNSNGATKQNQNKVPEFVEAGNMLAMALINLGYKLVTQDDALKQAVPSDSLASGEGSPKCILWRGHFGSGGNHYNHLHVSNKSGSSSSFIPRVFNKIKSFFTSDEEGDEVKPKVEPIEQRYCQIMTNINEKGPVPVLIAHPTKELQEEMLEVIEKNFPYLIDNFVFVYPNTFETTWKDMSDEVNAFLEKRGQSISDVSVIFYGTSSESKNMRAYTSMDNVQNIVLINPPLTNFITRRIGRSKSKIWIGLNPDEIKKAYGEKEYKSFVDGLKSSLEEKSLVIEDHLKEIQSTSSLELIKKTLQSFQRKLIKVDKKKDQ